LLHEGKAFGLFEMGAHQPGQFKKSDLSLGLSIAAVISSALRNALLHEQLAKRQAELAEMSERLALAEESERRKIAAELHDETGQVLAAAKARLQVAMKQLGSPSILARQALRDTVDLLAHALDQVREISHGLHPALLDDIGLAGAVRWLAGQTEHASGIRIFVKTNGMDERLPEALEASLFRIIQEILVNIARHSKASRARVSLDRSTGGLKITIEDNGVGFDPDAEREEPKGLGLRILRQRIRWLGGEMGLQSERGKGTLVRITIPVEACDDKEH
jgi:signal transduction histidine kinase